MADWLEARGAEVPNKDQLLQESIWSIGVPSATADWLEARGAKLPNKDKLLQQSIRSRGVPNQTADWLEARGAQVPNKDQLLQESIQSRGVPSQTADWLEARGAQVPDKDQILQDIFSRRGPDNPLVTWLEERGAHLKAKDALLEQLCLECPPDVATLNWIDGFSTHSCDQTWQTLRTVFKSKARQAEWLLQKEARIKPRAVLLLLIQGNHGDGDDRVASYAMACRQDDFEHIFLTRGVRNTPRIVFEMLSIRTCELESGEGTILNAPMDLLRLRSGVLKAAIGWKGKEDWPRPIRMIDVAAVDLSFLIHYISKHPDDVDWGRRVSSWDCMVAMADEYMLDDLKSELERLPVY
jgi:hypothetical protein